MNFTNDTVYTVVLNSSLRFAIAKTKATTVLRSTLIEERLFVTDRGCWFCYASGFLLQRSMEYSRPDRRLVRDCYPHFHVSCILLQFCVKLS